MTMIRRITLADRQNYLDMADEFYHTDANAHPVPYEFLTETFERFLNDDVYGDIFICEEDSTPVGYMVTAKTWSQEGGGIVVWIEEIFVKTEYRGRGYGTEMFNFVFENCPATRYRLEAEPENEKAIRLYKRLGFSFMEYSSMVKELRYK